MSPISSLVAGSKVFTKHNGLSCCNALLPTASSSSVPTPKDLLVLFLPLTPGNSILKSFNALPLRRTTWYCCLPFTTPGIRVLSFPRHPRPVLVGSCYLVVSATFHMVYVDRDYHRLLVSFSRGPCCSLQLPRTLCFTWLDSHGLLSSRVASHPLTGLPFVDFMWTIVHSDRTPRTLVILSRGLVQTDFRIVRLFSSAALVAFVDPCRYSLIRFT
jgi:hypothetical protein